jgi:hypothetical protein
MIGTGFASKGGIGRKSANRRIAMPTTAKRIGTAEEYLTLICERIQLTETQFNTAVRRYRAVGEHLTEKETALDKLSPKVSPQGSMLQRTTIRPMRLGKEVVPFDLDTVCRCDFDPFAKTSQSLYGSVLSRLQSKQEYKDRIEEAQKEFGTSGKCIRLAYTSDDFYLDVVPTCVDRSDSEGIRLYMCDPTKWHGFTSPIQTWRRTDPFRFAAWFHGRCAVGTNLVEKRVVASVAPVPPQEEADVKAPLRKVVQLLKRQRDIAFLGETCRPTSIMLTTLAGRHYRGEGTIVDGLQTILDGISRQIAAAKPGRITVPNPADEIASHDGGIEDLANPLTDAAYAKFCAMIESMRKWLTALRSSTKPTDLGEALKGLAGAKVAAAVSAEVQDEVKSAGLAGSLGISASAPGIHILSEPKPIASIQPVRGNNFHKNG